MSGQQEDTEKSHDATPQKLLEARKKGEVARSVDANTAAAYAGLLIAGLTFGAGSLIALGETLTTLIDHSTDLAAVFFEGAPSVLMGGIMWSVIKTVLPIFLVPALVVCCSITAQRGFLVTPSKLKPKLNRISLISNAKNKFGRGGLFEFSKSFVKLLIYSACLTIFMRAHSSEIAGSLYADPGMTVSLLLRLIVQFLFIVLIVAMTIGAVDVFWQRQEHLRKNRMSHKDLRDEHKEAEGDPYLKQERRARAQGIATNQMMKDVPTADVVIVNPTHFAVALKWSRLPGEAPVCVAKGVDEIARTIRELAQENAVPVHSNPPIARALHKSAPIGEQIDPEFYEPVAAAIRFAEEMRKKAKGMRF